MKRTYIQPTITICNIALSALMTSGTGNKVNGKISGGVHYDDPGTAW